MSYIDVDLVSQVTQETAPKISFLVKNLAGVYKPKTT